MNGRFGHSRTGVWLALVLAVAALVALRQGARWRETRRHETRAARLREETASTAARIVPAAEDLTAAETTTIEIFKRVSPAVVSVANRALVRDLFGFRLYEVPQGAGSGFVWDKEGRVISNFHVVYRASAVTVTLQDGSIHDAEVIGVDPDHDIAVLKIDAPAEALTPIAVGTSRDLQVGQTVMAIGNPFGLDTSLSMGVVSALGRSIVSMTDRRIYDVIQTDAAINPGNSGGPLLDSAGRLIGINTAIVSPSGGYAGVGFAVPVDTVSRVVPQLIANGRVRRAGLGIQTVPDHITRQANIEGVAILRAVPGSAAEKADLTGVRQTREGTIVFGDVIVALDGVGVQSNDDLLAVLDRKQVGDKVRLEYTRDGKRRSVDVVLQTLD